MGEEIKSDYQAEQIQQPYSVEYSPERSGVFTVFAIARDNSGNFIMSDTVSFTTTTGSGEAPVVRIDQPTQSGEAEVVLDSSGSIQSVDLKERGRGYVKSPEIIVYGSGSGANLSVEVDTNLNSPTLVKLLVL